MRRFWRNNGLAVVLLAIFVATFVGQSLVGHQEYDDEQREHGQPAVGYVEYLESPAFLEMTMENWESEFLQMGAFITLTIWLTQKGSSQSKDPDGEEEVDREPDPSRAGAPGPVRRGGLALALYRHSLSLAFFGMFLLSFVLHAVGGAGEYNAEQSDHHLSRRVTTVGYMGTARFWSESLQNWQSEFLAIFAMVVLSIWLRQHGSPESKPVDAPHRRTGE